MFTIERSEYECKLCYKKCSTYNEFIEHIVDHDEPFTCEECYDVLPDEKDLRRHMASLHNVKPINCKICNYEFLEWRHLEDHMVKHTIPGAYRCGFCTKKYLTMRNFKKHLYSHRATINKRYRCGNCPKYYPYEDFLNLHKKVYHVADGDTCETKFNPQTEEDLKLEQLDLKKVHCNLCDATFLHQVSLRYHLKYNYCPMFPMEEAATAEPIPDDSKSAMKFVNKRGDRFVCDDCGRTFMLIETLLNHMEFHKKRTSCEVCGAAFVDKIDLNVHIENHHSLDKPFVCEYCSKGFKTEIMLTMHKGIHKNMNNEVLSIGLDADDVERIYAGSQKDPPVRTRKTRKRACKKK